MNKLIHACLAAVLSVFILTTGVFGEKVSTDIINAGVGARPLGMGKAFTALADDSNAIFLNPAGLGYQTNWELTSLSSRILNSVDYRMVGAAMPTALGTVGVGYLTTSSGAGFSTSTENVGGVDQVIPVSQISYRQDVAYLSLGRKLNENLSAGVGVKMQAQSFAGATSAQATGYNTDLSLLWKVNNSLSLGINSQNALSYAGSNISWSTGEKEKGESRIKIGGALRPNPQLVLALDSELSGASSGLLFHGGAEYKPVSFVSLRLGVDQNSAAAGGGSYSTVNNLTGGVGIEFYGAKFDYAYYRVADYSENSTHYFSISFSGVQDGLFTSQAKTEIKQAVSDQKLKNVVLDIPDGMNKSGLYSEAGRDLL
ncbi:hypothetical protein A2625_07695 [candidate division WOR-1 bacterium RIFCSPHIGHO2_01_FULL_53_15]|uniref:PorV/PorQ family protein n=1 Tax=candidate division WOR-1 bacterium RIFCSPHIGHO2_01_FULL_53_15 TaxID=1802564 RepID=A0A1F4Q4Z2_UNCSA|nr:MAG: hypothetical protein A2625_07695 [candidate division WOR-1 bacterium RIFCSPHIGHO2_01_FULL_53_15]OGC10543.1 MAG: hypothetical protein A3D23_01470 [candidate division WOR-1 bacterium RIFCSPHIGHO2_02_FULL_53_26]